MVIDFHHHFTPLDLVTREGFKPGEQRVLMQGGVPKFTIHERLYNMDMQLKDMEIAGVDLSVLTCNLGWDAPVADCRLINDKALEFQLANPKHFVGLAHGPVLEKAGLEEMARAVSQGLRGVTISSQVNGLPLDAKDLWPLYKMACDLDAVVFVHPVMVVQGYAFMKEYDLGRILGRELDLQAAVGRVIAGRVMEEFPALKIVFSHFGGGIAATKERLQAKQGRFGTLKGTFDESFDRIFFDLSGFEGGPIALQAAIAGIRHDRLVFATDYPQDFTGATTQSGKGVPDIRKYIELVRGSGLRQDEVDAILGGTAASLLKLR
ncbi:MAG: amidohydrolase family protein [Bryobacteraceae bacterium]